MTVSAQDVKTLRQRTGLGMMECKKALGEAEGDMEKAVDLLRQRGLAKMDNRTDREAAEGRIDAAVSDDRTRGAIVEVNTETDFTAGNDEFKRMIEVVAGEALKQETGEVTKTDPMQDAIDELRLTTKENVEFRRGEVAGGAGRVVGSYVHFTGKVGVLVELSGDATAIPNQLLTDLCMHIAAASPAPMAVKPEHVPEEVVNREREIAKQQAMDQGKPENIAEKIVEGKVRKFYEDHALLEQPFVKDDKQQVKDQLPEGVTVERFIRYALGE